MKGLAETLKNSTKLRNEANQHIQKGVAGHELARCLWADPREENS